MKPLPTFRQLTYLRALSEHRHFGRAAEACLATQSTLSAGLRELETLLGVTLVERDRRGVSLTPVGEDILARARRILAEAEDLVEAAAASGRPLTGLLRLGAIPTIGPYLLPGVLTELREAFPELKLYLREDQTARLLNQLRGGTLDAAIVALPYDTEGLETANLCEETVCVACPADHPLAAGGKVGEAQLLGETLLMLEDGHCLRDHALAACRLQTPNRDENLQATSVGTLMQMVAGGLGITLIPEMAVAYETDRVPGLVVRPLAERRIAREVALCWRKGAARTPDYLLLAATIRDVLADRAEA